MDRELLLLETSPASEETIETEYNTGSKLICELRELHDLREPKDNPSKIKGSKRKSEIPHGTIEKITKIFRGEKEAEEGVNPSDILELVIK